MAPADRAAARLGAPASQPVEGEVQRGERGELRERGRERARQALARQRELHQPPLARRAARTPSVRMRQGPAAH